MTLINTGTTDDDGTGDPLVNAAHILNGLLGGVRSRTDDVGAATATRGFIYIVPASATGAWASQDNKLAYYDGSAWQFSTPTEGTEAYVQDDNEKVRYDGASWATIVGGGTTTQILGGGRELLAESTTVTSNFIDITGLDLSPYKKIEIEIEDVTSSTDDYPFLQLYTNATLRTTNYDGGARTSSINTTADAIFRDTASIPLSDNGTPYYVDATANDGRWKVEITRPNDAIRKIITGSGGHTGDTGAPMIDEIYSIQTDTNGIDGVRLGHNGTLLTGRVRIYGIRDTGSPLPVAFKGFRALAAGTQAISATTDTQITVFTTAEFDTDGGFAADEYTVPASLDGKYMVFSAGLRFNSNEDLNFYIRIDRGAGDVELAQGGSGSSSACTVTSGPILVNEGDVISLHCFANTSTTIENNDRNFFSGYVVESSEDSFEYEEDTGTSRTLAGADFKGNKTLEMNNAGSITLTLNTGLAVNGPLTIIQGGAGTITINGTATIESNGSLVSSGGQNTAMTLIPTNNTDVYKLIGSIS